MKSIETCRSVRFSQQLVLFAPQAVPVHVHVQGLIPTLYSRQVDAASVICFLINISPLIVAFFFQPSLRYLAVSTLRHLIERDPVRP